MSRARLIRKIIKYTLLGYLVFAFAGSSLPLALYQPDGQAYADAIDSSRFYKETGGPDQVVLLDDPLFSGVSRLYLIEQANEQLDIAYHKFYSGLANDLFYAAILEAADRGVHVRLIVDGVFHNLLGSNKSLHYALISHPQIELRFFLPPHGLKPWQWHGRLHDKHIIVDQAFVLTGGRNIGDRYYFDCEKGHMVYDRDILLLRDLDQDFSSSVISQFCDYFTLTWESPLVKADRQKLTAGQLRRGAERKDSLLENLAAIRQQYPEHFPARIDWSELAYETNQVSLIHNPIMSPNLEPWILHELSLLMKQAREQIIVQSPFIVPVPKMNRYLDFSAITVPIEIITNSVSVSPNVFAMAGYTARKSQITAVVDEIYEYHGKGSMHTKTFIIDHRISLVGTFNIDARSAFINTESMVVIDSESFASALLEQIEEQKEQSLAVIDPALSGPVKPRPVPWYYRLFLPILVVLLYPFHYLL